MRSMLIAFIAALLPLYASWALNNGMSASTVVGQANFTDNSPGLSASSFNKAASTLIDTKFRRLYVADTLNNRVLSFDLNDDGTLIDDVADGVLGQPDFLSSDIGEDQDSLANPFGLALDQNNNLLFVSSGGDETNNRVMVFDITTISNGEPAIHVLGQANFTDNFGGVSASEMERPMSLTYDNDSDRLFVGDRDNNRVLVFDLSSGITNGMDAVNVLGQPDFVSNVARLDQSSIAFPRGLAYDHSADRLFVSDQSNARIMVFDLSGGVSNNMNATNVLGQPDFVTCCSNLSQSGLDSPAHISFDPVHNQLYASDIFNSRVVVWDTATITNGEDASFVLGQDDFVSNTQQSTQDGMDRPQGVSYNQVSGQVYVADRFNNRVLVFDASPGDLDLDGVDDAVDTDDDGDGVDDSVQDGFPNGGDTNGDGTADSQQTTVSSNSNPVTGAHTTLESEQQDCSVDTFMVSDEASLPVQDPLADYPVGLNDFVLDCVSVGASVDLTVFYDQDYDTTGWSYKKFDDSTNSYVDMTSSVTFGTANVGGTTVTTVTYTVTDGGPLDQDGVANGVIEDPSGPSLGGQVITMCNGLEATIIGTEGDDVITGTSGVDIIAGLGGEDIIEGKGGDDIICGGDGDDILRGNNGADTIFGDDGHDTLIGNKGADELNGGRGDDIAKGGKDMDTINGDDGADILRGGGEADVINGNGGDDIIKGGDGADVLSGNGGDDIIKGKAGDDVLNGNGGFNILDGGTESDSCTNGAVLEACET